MPEYVVPEQQVEDMKKSYEGLLLAEDILKKLRAAGEPNPQSEVLNRELQARAKRYAAAFNVELE